MALRAHANRRQARHRDPMVCRKRHTSAWRRFGLRSSAPLALATLALVSGCVSESEGPGRGELSPASGCGTDKGPGRGELSSGLRAELEEFCAWWGRTNCEIGYERSPHRVDTDYCATTTTRTCIDGFIRQNELSFAEGRLEYHPEVREKVAEDLRLLKLPSYSEREAVPSWRALFQGTVPNGEPCQQEDGYGFYVNECANGYCPYGERPGTCRPFPGPGDTCDYSERLCSPSAYCDGVCVERPTEGEECDPGFDICAPPLLCRASSDGTPSVCGLPAELGDECEGTRECSSGACLDGVCALSALGDACMVASECELALTCQSYTCVERQVGADSGTQCSSDRDCVEEQMCLSGDLWSGCGEPVRLGSGCNPYQGCPAGLVCRSDVYGFGVCGPPGEVGDACGTEDCAVGLYCAGRDFERMMKGTCAATGPYVGCDPTP